MNFYAFLLLECALLRLKDCSRTFGTRSIHCHLEIVIFYLIFLVHTHLKLQKKMNGKNLYENPM